jgi:hypothetical protein
MFPNPAAGAKANEGTGLGASASAPRLLFKASNYAIELGGFEPPIS